MANQARIVKDPNILGGKPIIEGTRLSVSLIQEHVVSGFTEEFLLSNYPRLTSEGIKAALRYAEEHGMVPFEDFAEWDKLFGINRSNETGKADSAASPEK